VLWKAGFGDVWLAHHDIPDGALQRAGWRRDRAIALARPRPRREHPRVSVVVPVFNEAATVGVVLEELATRDFAGLELEVVVVESNSTDGSRQLVNRYRDHPRFRVVLEDRPRGKGHAVRTGLAGITGDVVLIQDADLEYDFLDYEMLLRPVLDGRAAFVLGTRHAGHWKIRRFAQHRLADLMNLAHWALVFLMNRMYRQSMTDPFTMFKVFRADCLAGLDLECNRFDFDIELVCKLLRKGYRPLEIPVNYQARSFAEGKKVRIFRDPLTWLRAMWKYRRAPVVRMPAAGSGGEGQP
jgi:glycosyltransferase involved in cell wall biosynthesis